MRYLRFSRSLIPLLLLALVAVAPLPASAQSKGAVNKAKAAEDQAFVVLREADAELEAGVEKMDRIEGRIHTLNWRMERLGTAVTEYGDSVTNLKARARFLLIEAYTSGGRNLVTSAFSSSSIQDLITSRALYDEAAARNLSHLDQLAAVSRQMERLSAELAIKETEVDRLRVEHREVVEYLAEVHARASKIHATAKAKYRSAYAKYRTERARAAAAAAARASGAAAGIPNQTRGVVCPVAGSNYFGDSWGDPRSGGRTHKGTDLMARYNTPLVAMNSGTVRLNRQRLGGIQIYVYGTDGITYYYAHLSKWVHGMRSGDHVSKGQVIGYVGDSGNARGGAPHLHLGIIAGGIHVNPYPTVRRVC
ncbi:MAG: peptidoglycan DD-metalloendopeptidase family protein [Actinomycetota bacterium]|nr:peptidoglycan DD-metalloendopeptidase family protein [Actinomycetota bacterium]